MWRIASRTDKRDASHRVREPPEAQVSNDAAHRKSQRSVPGREVRIGLSGVDTEDGGRVTST